MNTIAQTPGSQDLMRIAKQCGALYICPRNRDGTRKGPLVPCAGRDEGGRNFVSDIYINFRRVERHPHAVMAFAEETRQRILDRYHSIPFKTVIGIPQGGRSFGQMLAYATRRQSAYADKAPIATPAGRKQEYCWNLSQFNFEDGVEVALAEDMFNNFNNTDETLALIAETGAEVVMLVAAFSRSTKYDQMYVPKTGPYVGRELPVVAAVRKPIVGYQQNDPYVAADVAAGNIEFAVKENWDRLLACMDPADLEAFA